MQPSWKCPNIELWRSYVNYVKSTKETQREEVIKAFEFALENIGIDINSIQLWQDYIHYLRDHKVMNII